MKQGNVNLSQVDPKADEQGNVNKLWTEMMITYLWQVNIKRQQFNQNLNIKVWSRTLNYNRLLTKSELRSSL